MQNDDLMIFSGSGSQRLTAAVCDFLGVPVGRALVKNFSDGNTFVHVEENVRGRDVFVIQSTIHRTNDRFMELLFWIDALKRASAASVTAVIPYFSYGKGDKKDEPRVSIRARVCADAIEAAGCDRVVTMDLHSAQIQGFFHIPVDNLQGLPTLGDQVKRDLHNDLVVVAADTGFVVGARQFARYLNTSVAVGIKQRPHGDEKNPVLDIVGNVKGKTALIVDDFIISGGTLIEGAKSLKAKGAARVFAAATHGIFSMGSMASLENSELERIYVTDTVENHPESLTGKIHVVPVASCFGEAIRRISRKESISAMFTA